MHVLRKAFARRAREYPEEVGVQCFCLFVILCLLAPGSAFATSEKCATADEKPSGGLIFSLNNHAKSARVDVLDDGKARISWYTSESATESISLDGTVIHTDEFATKKNHEHITTILSDGDYTLSVVSADASGNSNSSTIEFTVDVGASGNTGNNGNNNGGTTNPDSNDDKDETSSEISSTTLQVAVLAVVFLLIVAFIRVSKNDNDENDKWA